MMYVAFINLNIVTSIMSNSLLLRTDVFCTVKWCFTKSCPAMSKNLKKYLQKSLFLYVKLQALRLFVKFNRKQTPPNTYLTDLAVRRFSWQSTFLIFWLFPHIYFGKVFKMLLGKIYRKSNKTVGLSSLTASLSFTTWFLPRKCWK